jgi:transcription factor SPN1
MTVTVTIVILLSHWHSSKMQARRPLGLSPLAIVLPHPPLPLRPSSIVSTSSSSPRTPRTCASPTCPPSLFTTPNRKSSDSWNSSTQDETDLEWKSEQVLLLSRVRTPPPFQSHSISNRVPDPRRPARASPHPIQRSNPPLKPPRQDRAWRVERKGSY